MRRPGLFYQFFWRILALLALTMIALTAFVHLYQQRRLYEAWQADLNQEAAWISHHWHSAGAPERLARIWRETHDIVRLSIAAPDGRIIADSDPAAPQSASALGSSPGHLAGKSPINIGGKRATLVLSRPSPRIWTEGPRTLLLWAAVLILLAAAAFYPLIRQLTRTFAQLSAMTRRVATGEFGATIEAKGQPELVALIVSFNDMSLRLRNEEVRRQRLIGDISHELRSPMARLRALGETIARHPGEAEAHLGQLESEIGLMDRLIGDMLETARFDERRPELSFERLSLDQWAEDAFHRFRPQIEQAGAACVVDLQPCAVEVLIDPQRMIQALGNLVENAIKAVAGLPDASVKLALAVTADQWSVSVQDNGPGMSEKDLPFLFDRFFRAEAHRGHSSGAGLGLSIARAIVEAHGGTITLENAEPCGAIARMSLSLTRP